MVNRSGSQPPGSPSGPILKPGGVLIGLGLIALGILFLLDRAGALEAGETIRDWWPVAIVALGGVQLFDRPRSLLGPGIVIGVGVILLLFTLDLIEGSAFNLIWPAVLILVGVAILFRHGRRRGSEVIGTGDDVVRSTAIFGGNELVSRSSRFAGGSLTAIFGGITLDLRDAQLASQGASLSVTAAFGGVEVIVPKGWRVSVSGTPIFGGFDVKTETDGPVAPDAPELRVDLLAIFGGGDIKHKP